VSALDVLEGRVAPGEFRGKRVVIGVTAPGPDVHRTPFERMRGAEIQANALDTIVRGAPLQDAPPLLDVLAILLLAILPALTTLTRRRWLAAAVIVVAVALFLAIAQLAFNAGWILAVVVPLTALLAATLGAAGLAALQARSAAALQTRSAPSGHAHAGLRRDHGSIT
jgi:adenylate cyclase